MTEAVHDETRLRQVERVAERERVAVELLQRAALPASLPTAASLTIGAHYQPASNLVIGGDWYDAFRLDASTIAFVIADVGGHGPDAAGYMVQIRNILRAIAIEHHQPDEILRRVNRVAISFDDPRDPFTTCCVILLAEDTRAVTVSLAGHPPPVLAHAGATRYVGPAPGPPLGIWNDAEYTATTITAAAGDRVVMYTDGLIERKDEPINDGLARLQTAVAQCLHLDPQSATEFLAATLSPGLDDVALLVIDFSAA